MKELSIEEKAKAYDEAKARMSAAYNSNRCTIGFMSEIFPELKESEDEKIRNEIIDFINYQAENGNLTDEQSNLFLSWLFWLEKQGEQKFEMKTAEESLGIDSDTYNKIVDECIFGEQKPTNSYCQENCKGYQETGKCFADGECKAKREAEQKLTDKVEPKFKIGDWVINRTDATIMQILNNEDFYESVEIGGQRRTDTYNYVEWDFRLWTIQDAKDGDVLHSTGFHSDCVFIFNGLDNWKFDEPNGDRAVATGYCGLFVSADKMEFGMQGPDCIEVDTVKPASKIQRDLLFQKMKEAGYEWDAENKKLKGIEQIWSEEDEKKVNGIITILKPLHETKCSYHKYKNSLIDWLKSLKDRCISQPKQEWSEEDERKRQEAIRILSDAADSYTEGSGGYAPSWARCIPWLKSLRPQAK